jgi:molybdate transport system regulatory protein
MAGGQRAALEQRRRPAQPYAMPKRAPELQPRLRFPHAGPDAFGPGKAELLRHIAATGSIRTAARELGMSYNRAWQLVATMNDLFRAPLVARARGGGTGGGATLTALGETVLTRYTRMEAACRDATRADWTALMRELK